MLYFGAEYVDLYQELELNQDCSSDQIKNQYRMLAQRHHPDKGGDVDRFQRIKLAYEVLIDPVRRQEYDRTGSTQEFRDLKVEAVEHLSKIFHNVINNFDPNQGDLVEIMKDEVRNLQNLIKQDQQTCKNYIEALETVRDKIKIIDEYQENIILSFVLNQLELRYNEQKVFQRREAMADVMIKLLENYHYGFFELPQN